MTENCGIMLNGKGEDFVMHLSTTTGIKNIQYNYSKAAFYFQ